MTSSQHILFVTYGGGHVNIVIPVIRRIREKWPEWQVSVLGMTNSIVALDAAGIEHFGFARFLQPADDDVRTWGEMLAERLPDSPVPREESVAYLGFSYADLVAEHGEDRARTLYEGTGRQSFLPVRTLQRIIASVGPDLVVASSAPRAERAAIIAAKRSGVKALCMVDLFAIKEVEWLQANDFADRVCVIADFVRERIVAAGRSPDAVTVTGNPAFDGLADPSALAQGKAIRDANGWQQDFVVLLASQPEPEVQPGTGIPSDVNLPIKVERALEDIVLAMPNAALVVRYHPSQEQPVRPDRRCSISRREEPLEPLLNAVNCVVTFSSTVGLQAILLGKPLITIDYSANCRGAPYSRLGLSTGVSTPDDLPHVLEGIRAGTASVPEHILPAGGAAERVVTEMEFLLGLAGAGGNAPQ